MKVNWLQIFKYDYYLLNFMVSFVVCLVLVIIPLSTGFAFLPGSHFRQSRLFTDASRISGFIIYFIIFGIISLVICIYRIHSIYQRFKFGTKVSAEIIFNESWPTIIKYRYSFNSKEYSAFCRVMDTTVAGNCYLHKTYDVFKNLITSRINIVVNTKKPKKTYLYDYFIQSEI